MTPLSRLLLGLLFTAALFAQDHLLISEFAVSPTAGEFVEIHNPTGAAIDLSDYYLTDGTRASSNDYYYNLVSGAVSVLSTDFIARFPDGASIAPGEYQTVAMSGSAFRTTYGQDPTYEVIDSDAQLTNMREALSGSIGGSSGLSNNGEVLILFFWDGAADLVADVDYAVWGDKEEGVDKTGISADGPDADSDSSAFLNDTALDQQISVSSSTPHADGESVQRLSLTEIGETASGGNGITGHDETSENLAQAFTAAAASPNSAPPASQPPVVGSISISPSIPTSSDSVLVSATLTDDVAIGAGRLYYSIDGGAYDSTGMDNLPGGDQYVAGILPQPENTVVSYVVRAIDSDGQSDYSDTLSYTVSAPAQLTPIADIQANPGNYSNVIIEGVVVIGAGVIDADRSRIYVQDNSGRGILCFSSAAPSTLPAGLYERGNLVRVIGSVTEFEGVTEIDNFSGELISTGNPIPDALELSTQGAGDVSLEGTYIQTTGTITDLASGLGGGTNVGLDDGSGQVTIRVWDDTGIDLSAFSLGGEMTVRGVLGIFNAATQVTPGYQDEVTAPGVNPGDGSGTATISPDSVGTGQSLAATLTVSGDPSYTLAEVSVSIPAGWNWSNNAADVALSGSGFGGASAVVSGGQIRVSGAAVSSTASGSVTINNLTASSNNTTSTFTVRTATDGGSLVAIASSPRVIVGLGGPPITPISDIQANPTAFSTVTIEGVVTVGANTIITSRTEAYIQDESGRGINVFSFDAPNVEPNPLLVRGNRLRMTGTVEEFQGITEITNYTIELLGADQPLPAPLVLSTNAAGDLSLEGTRVEVTGIATI
ncbi:MAG: lamin tail domain-containing protein, partial [Calditrichaeota bacterium]|nr:lamin tail domain-containing protein [Calditrichota bacterium]